MDMNLLVIVIRIMVLDKYSNGDITICGSYKIEKNENYKL
jgi:hypothetical protein